MLYSEVRTINDAFAYITDCNLATVCHMATLKSRKKGEFERQISIAQKAIDWACEYGIDMETTRAQGIIEDYGRSVWAWVQQYIEP